MTAFKPSMATRTSVVVVLLVVAALIIGGVVIGAGALRSDDYRIGQVTGSDSNEDDTVVAAAGDVSISARELREAVMHLQQYKEYAERELQGLGEDTGQPTDYLEARHNLVLKWGDDNVALSGLIQEHILYQKAVELGYDATEEEVEENIQWARDAYKRGQLDAYKRGQLDAYNQEWIESVGEDHYFENIYPALVTRSMATDKLYEGVAKEVGTRYHDGEPPLRYTLAAAVLSEAEITVHESEEHSATLEGVMGYLNDVRETNIAYLRKDDDLPAAP